MLFAPPDYYGSKFRKNKGKNRTVVLTPLDILEAISSKGDWTNS